MLGSTSESEKLACARADADNRRSPVRHAIEDTLHGCPRYPTTSSTRARPLVPQTRHFFSMALDSAWSFLLRLERSVGLDEFPKYRQEGAEKSDYPFLLLFVCFTLLVYVVETYLDLRQHGNLKAQAPPSTLLEVLKTVDEDNQGLEAVSKVRMREITTTGVEHGAPLLSA